VPARAGGDIGQFHLELARLLRVERDLGDEFVGRAVAPQIGQPAFGRGLLLGQKLALAFALATGPACTRIS
jgi:hypothetical protein